MNTYWGHIIYKKHNIRNKHYTVHEIQIKTTKKGSHVGNWRATHVNKSSVRGIWPKEKSHRFKPSKAHAEPHGTDMSPGCLTLHDTMDCSPWNSPGQNTGMGSLSLLQGIFPPQGSNPGLPYCRQILYQLSHKGSPRTLEWVAYPFSRGLSRPRNWTGVSCIAGRFFTNWAKRETPK